MDKILTKFPSIVNEPITDDGRTNAATRASYLGYTSILEILKHHGVDVNRAAGSGIPPIFWAAARGYVDTCAYLVDAGANLDITGPFDMNILDFSILYGYYTSAWFFHEKGVRPSKTAEDFDGIKAELQTPWVDYPGILLSLDCNMPPEMVPAFTLPPVIKPVVLEDPVSDPNETWPELINRVLEFRPPPQVER